MSRYLITISNYPGRLISLNVRGEARENLEIKLVDVSKRTHGNCFYILNCYKMNCKMKNRIKHFESQATWDSNLFLNHEE